MKKLFKYIGITMIVVFVVHLSFYGWKIGIPKPDPISAKHAERFMIEGDWEIQTQNGVECAAFASTFLLRTLGENISAETAYETFPGKLKSGEIVPKGLVKFFNSQGLDIQYYKGHIDTLKTQVEKGIPVIVFIRVEKEKAYKHYVPVVGFDEDYLYLAESLSNFQQKYEGAYNRKVLISDFLNLWDTRSLDMPYHKNTYFIVSQHEK